MNGLTPGLAPLVKLAGQLDDVASQIGHGVLGYEDPAAVAGVRHALRAAAERLVCALDSM